MKHWFKFTKQLLANPQQVGAVCASTRLMGRTMTDDIGIEQATSIVEIGPGDGVFTQVIRERKRADAAFMAVEINPSFCETLRAQFPDVVIRNGCVSGIQTMLAEEGMPAPEVVVSALPWSVFPEELQDKLLSAVIEAMAPGGVFASIAYLTGRVLPAGRAFRKKLGASFARIETSPIRWRNVPPAVAYRCWKAA